MASASNPFGLLPPNYRRAVLRMAEDYADIFGGRDAELAALDHFLAQDKRPYAFLLAPTGRGKTALLLHWIQRLDERDDWATIVIPISRRYQTASARGTYGALAEALASFFGEPVQSATMSPDQLRPLIADLLRRPIESGPKLLVVLDGLDEAVGWEPGADLFPQTPGDGVRVVASARQLAHRELPEWMDMLGWEAALVTAIALPQLSEQALRQLLASVGEPLDHLLTQPTVIAELLRLSEGDPLTLRLIVEGLREGTLVPDQLASQMPGVEAQMTAWLADLQHVDAPAVELFLGLCAIALGPLNTEDMRQLAPDIFDDGRAVHQAATAVGRFVIGDGSTEAGYVFSHPRLREVYLERLLTEETRVAIQERFVAWGEGSYRQRTSGLAEYLRMFWITHLAEAGRWELAREVLTAIEQTETGSRQYWAGVRTAAEGSTRGYLGDLSLLWRWDDQQDDLGLALRCALIASSLRSLSGNLLPELLVGLVTVGTPEGLWTTAAALEHIRQMPEPNQQLRALKALLDAECPLSADLALEVARSITDRVLRAEALVLLAPRFDDPQRHALYLEAVAALDDMHFHPQHPGDPYHTLGILAPYLSENRLPEALTTIASSHRGAEALRLFLSHFPETLMPRWFEAAWAIEDTWDRVDALGELAPYPPTHLILEGWTRALALPDEFDRQRGLEKLAPFLPDSVLAKVMQQLWVSLDERDRVEVLEGIVTRLPDALIRDAFQMVAAVRTIWRPRDHVLAALLPRLPVDLLPEAMRLALSPEWADNEGARDWLVNEVVARLAERLPPPLFEEALVLARQVPDAARRARILAHLLRAAPPDIQDGVVEEIFTALMQVESPFALLSLLPQLAPCLPALARDRTAAITWERCRPIFNQLRDARLVQMLLSYPAPTGQPKLLAELTAGLCALQGELGRPADLVVSSALRPLLPHLPEPLLRVVLERVRRMQGSYGADMIATLVPLLPAELFDVAVEVAQALTPASARAQALTALAPYLPSQDQPAIYGAALSAAQRIGDIMRSALTRAAYVPYIDDARRELVYAAILEAAEEIASASYSCEELYMRVAKLPAHVQHQTYERLLDRLPTLPEAQDVLRVLKLLMPHLPADLHDTACEQALSVGLSLPLKEHGYALADLLVQIAASAPSHLLDSMLRAARSTPTIHKRIQALAALAARLPAEQRPALFEELAGMIGTIPEHYNQVDALRAILPAMSETALEALVERLLRSLAKPQNLIGVIGPYLSATLAVKVLDIVRALEVDSPEERFSLLLALAPFLPNTPQAALFREMLGVIEGATSAEQLTPLLPNLVPHLPPELVDRSYDLAMREAHAAVLLPLLPRLDGDRQVLAAQVLLNNAREAREPVRRAESIVRLVPYLPQILHGAGCLEALKAVCERVVFWSSTGNFFIELAPELIRYGQNHPEDRRLVRQAWQAGLHRLAHQGRFDLLYTLAWLAPWLATIQSQAELAEMVDAIDDITRCWT